MSLTTELKRLTTRVAQAIPFAKSSVQVSDTGEYQSGSNVFGGFNALRKVHKYEPTTHTGTNSIVSFSMESNGTGGNGPYNADIPVFIEVSKEDYLTSTTGGEVDGAYIVSRQGAEHDSGGLLIDARKVSGGTGGCVGTETLVAFIDSTGAVEDHVQTINGFVEGAGGFTGGGAAGFVAEPRKGNVHSGFAAVGRSDLPAQFVWAFYAAESRDPNDRWFGVSGSTGHVHIGKPAEEVTLRNTNTNLEVHRQDGARIARFRPSGVIEAVNGLLPSAGSSTITRVHSVSSDVAFGTVPAYGNAVQSVTVTGAAVGDLVSVSPTNNYASGNLVFTGRVQSDDTVLVQCQNIGTSPVVSGTQTLVVKAERLSHV